MRDSEMYCAYFVLGMGSWGLGICSDLWGQCSCSSVQEYVPMLFLLCRSWICEGCLRGPCAEMCGGRRVEHLEINVDEHSSESREQRLCRVLLIESRLVPGA